MTAIQALLGFVAVTLLLVASIFLYRGVRFLRGTPINHWPRGNKPVDDAPLIKRIEDAHANCLENLPVFATIVLAAAALHKLELLAPIAVWLLYARIGQIAAHLSGVGPAQVLVRASFWSAQLALMVWMLVLLVP
ncbi:MAG: MAPEG family protein [Rhodoferax sp.]|nr:MAPEG family protein [Rhodoferax sp.]